MKKRVLAVLFVFASAAIAFAQEAPPRPLRVQVFLSEYNKGHAVIELREGKELPKPGSKEYAQLVEGLKLKFYINAFPGINAVSLYQVALRPWNDKLIDGVLWEIKLALGEEDGFAEEELPRKTFKKFVIREK